jgi:hypothetical protein
MPQPGSTSTSFVETPELATYGYPLFASGAATTAGDLNSTYDLIFYSITNANAIYNATGGCPLELVLVGTFPDARYLSITDNDMHYSATQHLADFEVDPVGTSITNPFQSGVSYTGAQQYMVPVSLGYLPTSTTPGCGITPFESDNLLDATQRHPSSDWNTDLADVTGVNPHFVDMPTHLSNTGATGNSAGPNTAGMLTVRNYLSPETCTGTPGSGSVICGSPNPPPLAYVIVRDATTGCAYNITAVKNNGWLDDPLATPAISNPTTAVVSTVDRAKPAYGSHTEWMDEDQTGYHAYNADLIPQACYASGNAGSTNNTNVAFARSPDWVALPSPDDSYIGGAIPTTDLNNPE